MLKEESSNGSTAFDNVTVLCNFIEMFLTQIGGSREKNLPPLKLEETKKLAPIFNDNLDQAVDATTKEISLSPQEEFLEQQIQSGELIEKVLLKMLEENFHMTNDSDSTIDDHFQLSDEQILAAKLFAKYCPHLTLEQVQQISCLNLEKKAIPCFDWFSALALHIFGGNVDRCKNFLLKFWRSEKSSFLWPRKFGIHGNLPLVAHHVEAILQAEEPLLYQTMSGAGISVSVVVDHWLSQVFLNLMNLDDVVRYIAVVVTFGVDFVAYFCVSVFVFLRDQIMDFRTGSRLSILIYLPLM